jgi:hypothetical protein
VTLFAAANATNLQMERTFMSNASVEVTGTEAQAYEVTVTRSNDQPVAGTRVDIALAGEGSLWPSKEERERTLYTNWYGVTPVKWYASGQNQKATLTATTAETELQVQIRPLKDATDAPLLAGSGSN